MEGFRESIGGEKKRITAFWGDETWINVAYRTDTTLFGYPEKEPNIQIVKAFCKRLKEKANFNEVPKPMPMRNTKGSVVYYLIFASQKPVAKKIVSDIFKKYKEKGKK
ncbi:hypothetical protein JXI42_10645 [bacterium]|nr:hypothetical protein [bacterium]